MDCFECKKPIEEGECYLTFYDPQQTEPKAVAVTMAHSCCFQELLLYEILNARCLGANYDTHCPHLDYTSKLKNDKFLVEQRREIQKVIQQNTRK